MVSLRGIQNPRYSGRARSFLCWLNTKYWSHAMPRMLRIGAAAPAFDVEGLLRSAAVGATGKTYQPGHVIYSQGDVSDSVMYLPAGSVKLSVLSRSGKEAVVAMLEPGAFFGESALAGFIRHETATGVGAGGGVTV